jgi:hypothetical protein
MYDQILTTTTPQIILFQTTMHRLDEVKIPEVLVYAQYVVSHTVAINAVHGFNELRTYNK